MRWWNYLNFCCPRLFIPPLCLHCSSDIHQVYNRVMILLEQAREAKLPVSRATLQTFRRKSCAAVVSEAKTDAKRKKYAEFTSSEGWLRSSRATTYAARLYTARRAVSTTKSSPKASPKPAKHGRSTTRTTYSSTKWVSRTRFCSSDPFSQPARTEDRSRRERYEREGLCDRIHRD